MKMSLPSEGGEMNVPAKDLPKEKPTKDFRESFHWRILRIMSEFTDGFQFLADFKKTVSIFGTARAKEGDKWYEEARHLANMLAKEGFTIVTGGGPGIMEAANRGAVEAGDHYNSVGLNIQLPEEQRVNPYVRKGLGFHYFFVRKVMLSYVAQAYIFFPGGFGTLDEFFELTMLVQTKKIEPLPIILVGKEYWQPLVDWLLTSVEEKYGAIDKEDTKIYTLADSVEEAFKIVKSSKERTELYTEH